MSGGHRCCWSCADKLTGSSNNFNEQMVNKFNNKYLGKTPLCACSIVNCHDNDILVLLCHRDNKRAVTPFLALDLRRQQKKITEIIT